MTDNNEPAKKWVDKQLAKMSLREKIGQTVQETVTRLPVKSFTPEEIEKYLKKYPIGSLFVRSAIVKSARNEVFKGFGNTDVEYRDNLQMFQEASSMPLLVSGDLESGAGAAIPNLTLFPCNMSVGAANDEELAYKMGKFTGIQSKTAGFSWNFAPVCDLAINWLNPAVGTRAIGDDPENVSKLAVALMKGMQSEGLGATAKHFPGDGVDYLDQHICTTVNGLSEEEWWQKSGRVFQEMIDAGVCGIMTGHIALPWLEPIDKKRHKHVPATVSKLINTDLLRGKMGFEGVVISDALDMAAYVNWDDYENRMIESFNAGIDVMLWPGFQYFDLMEKAVDDGRVSIERIDESARRVLEMKCRLGLIKFNGNDTKLQAIELSDKNAIINLKEEAEKTSCEIGARSVTLVRNRNGILPLKQDDIKKVLVAKLNKATEDCVFEEMDYFISKLKSRNFDLEIIDYFEPINIFNILEDQEGKRWDAFLVPFMMPIHGLVNTVRPIGNIAKGLWALQQIKTIEPIYLSMGTPFLLQDIPFAETLVNAYSHSPATIDMLDKAIFGEIPFSSFSPVNTGGWEGHNTIPDS